MLISFIGVMCDVGIDRGTNTLAPKNIMNRLDIPLVDASFGSSLYFIARLVGCFCWSLYLDKVHRRLFFIISVGFILVSFVALLFVATKPLIYLCIILIGIGNANLFPIIFSQTVLHIPE